MPGVLRRGLRVTREGNVVDTDRDVKVAVVYYSRFGSVAAMAQAVAEGCRRVPGAEVLLYRIGEEPPPELADLRAADALVVGTPAYFGNAASPALSFFETLLSGQVGAKVEGRAPWWHQMFQDKVGAAFVSCGAEHAGSEHALQAVLRLMMHLGMVVVTPGLPEPMFVEHRSPYGAVAVAGPGGDRPPNLTELDAARELGERVATVAMWMRLGRIAAMTP